MVLALEPVCVASPFRTRAVRRFALDSPTAGPFVPGFEGRQPRIRRDPARPTPRTARVWSTGVHTENEASGRLIERTISFACTETAVPLRFHSLDEGGRIDPDREDRTTRPSMPAVLPSAERLRLHRYRCNVEGEGYLSPEMRLTHTTDHRRDPTTERPGRRIVFGSREQVPRWTGPPPCCGHSSRVTPAVPSPAVKHRRAGEMSAMSCRRVSDSGRTPVSITLSFYNSGSSHGASCVRDT